jgi:hypothetical protein
MKHHAAAFASIKDQRGLNDCCVPMPILTDNAGERCIEEVWIFVNARLALRISLIAEKLQVVVVLLFAKVIQGLEPLHVQVEVVSGQVQIAASRRRVAFEFVV